jgi:hypothetical protein
VQTLPIPITGQAAAVCNQNPPAGWPNIGATANFVLTDATITAATLWWVDEERTTATVTKVCSYPVVLFLNQVKALLPQGTYPGAIRAESTAAGTGPSRWGPLNVSFQRPGAVPTPLPPAVPRVFRIVGL